MPDNYFARYIPLLIQFCIAFFMALGMVVASQLLGRHRYTRAKFTPYECGMTPVGDSRERFSVKFYLVAMLFILFDVEAVFLPVGGHLQETEDVRVRRDDGVHRHRAGRPLVRMEKGRARLGREAVARAHDERHPGPAAPDGLAANSRHGGRE